MPTAGNFQNMVEMFCDMPSAFFPRLHDGRFSRARNHGVASSSLLPRRS